MKIQGCTKVSMFDRFIDLLVNIWGSLLFWEVVDDNEGAVLLRLGRYRRMVQPGLCWKLPFNIDVLFTATSVTDVLTLAPQSLTTKDDQGVVISVRVVYRINNMKKFFLQAEDANAVLADSACGEVSSMVLSSTWKELLEPVALERLNTSVKRRAIKFGIHVEDVVLADLSRSRSYRFWQTAVD